MLNTVSLLLLLLLLPSLLLLLPSLLLLLPSLLLLLLQFWVWSLYSAMSRGVAGIKPIPAAKLAAESSRSNGKFVCIPNKIKF
jgi:hypothetical protein